MGKFDRNRRGGAVQRQIRAFCRGESGAVTADMLGVIAVASSLGLSAISEVSSVIHGSGDGLSEQIVAVSGEPTPTNPGSGGQGSDGGHGGDLVALLAHPVLL